MLSCSKIVRVLQNVVSHTHDPEFGGTEARGLWVQRHPNNLKNIFKNVHVRIITGLKKDYCTSRSMLIANEYIISLSNPSKLNFDYALAILHMVLSMTFLWRGDFNMRIAHILSSMWNIFELILGSFLTWGKCYNRNLNLSFTPLLFHVLLEMFNLAVVIPTLKKSN